MQVSSYSQLSYNPSFNGKIDKTIEIIKSVKDYKRARITPEEAIKIYNKLGYITRAKAGSHMTITAPDGFAFSLQLPHGNEKRFIHPFDVKRLKYAILGDRQSLIDAIKI